MFSYYLNEIICPVCNNNDNIWYFSEERPPPNPISCDDSNIMCIECGTHFRFCSHCSNTIPEQQDKIKTKDMPSKIRVYPMIFLGFCGDTYTEGDSRTIIRFNRKPVTYLNDGNDTARAYKHIYPNDILPPGILSTMNDDPLPHFEILEFAGRNDISTLSQSCISCYVGDLELKYCNAYGNLDHLDPKYKEYDVALTGYDGGDVLYFNCPFCGRNENITDK